MSLETLAHSHISAGDLGGFLAVLSLDELEVNRGDAKCDGWTLLHHACEEGKSDFVRALLLHPEIDANARDAAKQTPFWWACSWNREETMKEMLREESVDVNLPNDDGETPLWTAMYYGYTRVVLRLIASGKNLNLLAKARYAITNEVVGVREIAAKRGKVQVLKLFDNFVANPEKTRNEARTLLGYQGEDPYLLLFFIFYFFPF